MQQSTPGKRQNGKPSFSLSCHHSHLFWIVMAVAGHLSGCVSGVSIESPETSPSPVSSVSPSPSPSSILDTQTLLWESWKAYQQRFIQEDGRVIDRQDNDRSISEAQAYAMLRSLFIDDPEAFEKTLTWAENNLQREEDSLWAWKWGEKESETWGTIDANFATDADIDAVTALILASRRWNRPDYLELAQKKLTDIWNLATVTDASGNRYLLPGPKVAFVLSPSRIKLNPSYLAPYAFRLFAQVDPERDWMSLVESSYAVLEESSQLSRVGLPSDWVLLDTQTGDYYSVPATSDLETLYGFDAYRVWWRVALDAAWFDSPEASRFLEEHLFNLQQRWREEQYIPAQINLQGQPLVDYDSTSQYAMLYAALREVDPAMAQEIQEQKLLPTYSNGFWDNNSAYYVQNLAWFGLVSPTTINPNLLIADERL